MAASGLSFDWERRGDTAQVVVDGELDLETADILARRALALLDEGPDRLVLDLAGVTFCDSAGLSALFKVYGRAEDIGAHFVLKNLNAPVYRVLDATGFTSVIPLEEST